MGVKCLYSLFIVGLTVLGTRCDSLSNLSGEEETAAESYEITKKSLFDDNDSALEATYVGDGNSVDSRNTMGDNQLKRFMVSMNRDTDIGHEVSTNKPYFMQQQQQQRRQSHLNHHPHNHQQQQSQKTQQKPQQRQQSPPPPQQQQQQQPSQQHQNSYQYLRQGRGSVADHTGVGSPSPGGSNGHNEQSDGFYQSGGHEISFEATGFTDFAPPPPSAGYRAVAPSSSHLPTSFDDGSAGQLSYDPTGFGHESSPTGHGGGGGGGYDYPSHQAPVIHKSIYVHVAPPDDEPPRKQRVIFPNVPPKKNYQIVFIKAPTSPPPTAPIIPPPPQHTDKTLIYVLHPKQEEAPPIRIPPPPVSQPLKPEVYFIKYKNREASHAGDDFEFDGHGGHGGVLPSPGEEFGGTDVSGYPHRRYGREDQTSPTTSRSPPADVDENDHDRDSDRDIGVGDMTPEQRELAEVDGTAAAAGDSTRPAGDDREDAVDESSSFRSDYSTEYNDASVESSNLSETHVLQTATVTTTPKGKNGH